MRTGRMEPCQPEIKARYKRFCCLTRGLAERCTGRGQTTEAGPRCGVRGTALPNRVPLFQLLSVTDSSCLATDLRTSLKLVLVPRSTPPSMPPLHPLATPLSFDCPPNRLF